MKDKDAEHNQQQQLEVECRCEKFEEIAKVIDSYKSDPGNLIQILHASQEIFGYLPLDVQQFIADKLNIPVSQVSGVVSFYSFFSTKPKGKHTIMVCLGTACYVRGGKKIVDGLKKKLNVDVDDTTEDGNFTLKVARCIGACGLAPAMMIDNEVHKQVNINKLDSIINKYKEE